MRALRAVPFLALGLLGAAACDDKHAATDAGSTKTLPTPSVRTTRLDCGGKFGPCPPGESCYYDAPGCDATGYCGPPEPACAHTTTFCGCHGMDFACVFPKHPWRDKGPQCITQEAYGAPPSGPAEAGAPGDAGARRDAK
jgi:hypothetical protein